MVRRGLLVLANVALFVTAAWWLAAGARIVVDSIERQIRSMPGVVATELVHDASLIERRTVLLDVELSPDVTEEQAVAVGETFVERMNRGRLDDHVVQLNLRIPAVPHPNPYVPDFSQASFWYNPSEALARPNASTVADSIGLWLRTTRSPVAAHVSLTQSMGSTKYIRYVDLTLRDNADPALIEALDDDIGDRANVTWRLADVADDTHKPHEYKATPAPPLAAVKTMYAEITELVDATDELEVWTSTSHSEEHADTSVTITIAPGPDREERTNRTAESVGQVLTRFGNEVTLNVHGHESAAVVVGGCYFREGQTSDSDLERHLRAIFETC